MSWSTELYCNISFNRETFNNKYEVEESLSSIKEDIASYEEELKALVYMTEPQKFYKVEDNMYYELRSRVNELLELLSDSYIQEYKLNLLLYNWDKCHDKDGLAIAPPDNLKAYLWGDFVEHNTLE